MIDNFRAAMQAHSLTPPEHIELDRFHRFPGAGKCNGNTAGWCKLFSDGQGGVYGDYSTGLSESWQAERAQPMSKTEQDAFRRRIEESRQQAEEQQRQDQEVAAAKAKETLVGADGDPAGHLYAIAKRVSFGPLVKRGCWPQRGWSDALLVPMFDKSGPVVSVQAISSNGDKDFLADGRKKGSFHPLGKIRGATGRVLIGEGLATVAAAVSATGLPGVVAFDAGNLLPVAKVVRELAPEAEIILLADDDRKSDTDKNPGIEAATKSTVAVGGLIAVPSLGKKADFWDLFNEQGPDAVRAAIDAVKPAEDQQGIPKDKPEPVDPIDPTAMIQQLAGLTTIEYELKRRVAAETLGMRATALDQVIKATRKGQNQNDLPFEEPNPWPEPVEPNQFLTDIAATIQRFIVCSKEVAQAAALWSVMTWFMHVVQVAPLAIITAPEKRCGKSQLLTLLGRLSARPITASSISPAALYRAIDLWSPTLLIDEADAFMKDNEELRGIINSGHTRDSAYVIRTVGDNFTPTKFSTWGAKAIAGIGHVADTLMDRAVVLELRRKLPHETVDRLRYAEPDLFSILQSKLARFADDYAEQVRQARPPLPSILNDRAQDNWEPLLAIAMVAGSDWLENATAAALKLTGTESAAQTIGTELLADIKEIFEMKGVDRISTADLIKSLCDDEEKVWSTYNRGNPIKPRQLSTKLRGYGINSNTIRIGSSTPKGFTWDQFEEVFSRYLTSEPAQSATPPQPLTDRHHHVADDNAFPQQTASSATNGTFPDVLPVADKTERCGYVAVDNASNLSLLGDCCGVADRSPLQDDDIIEVKI